MVETRTPTPIQAEDAATRKRLEDEQRQSMWDSIKGFLSDFGFGSLFEMGFLAAIVYGLMQIPGVQDFVKTNIIDRFLPSEMQGNVLGWMNKIGIDVDMRGALEAMDYTTLHTKLQDQVSPEILNIIDPNDNNKTLHDFLGIISKANGGKVTMKGFTSPETITALMIQKPEMARTLVIAAMKPDADGKPSSTAQQMSTSIKALIAGPQLEVLLAPEARANTIKILTAALPADAPIKENNLTDMINKGLDANGKPTTALRQLFSNAVNGNKDALVSSAYDVLGPSGVIDMLDANKMTSDAAKYAVKTIQQNPEAKAACADLIKVIGPEKAQAFISAFQNPDAGKNAIQLILTRENVQALPQTIKLLDQLPDLAAKLPREQAAALAEARQFVTPAHLNAITSIVNHDVDPLELRKDFIVDGKFSKERAVESLLQPEIRKKLQDAGIDNVAALAADENNFYTQRNLKALIEFADAVEKGNPASAPNSSLVMHAMAKVITGTPMHAAFQNLDGVQLATFFSAPENSKAVQALLNEKTGITGTTLAMQQEVELFRKDFNKSDGVGVIAILSDPKAAQFLLDHDDGKGPGFESATRTVMWLKGITEGGALNNADNRDIVIELGKALSSANATSSVASAPDAMPNTPMIMHQTPLLVL